MNNSLLPYLLSLHHIDDKDFFQIISTKFLLNIENMNIETFAKLSSYFAIVGFDSEILWKKIVDTLMMNLVTLKICNIGYLSKYLVVSGNEIENLEGIFDRDFIGTLEKKVRLKVLLTHYSSLIMLLTLIQKLKM